VKSAIVAAVLALAPLLSASTAAADPPCTVRRCRIESPSTLKTDGGSELRLPPGTFFPAPLPEQVDAELRRLQDAETRLAAENAALRASADELPFGWGTVLAVLAAAVAGGAGALIAF
jgi:hypothetical protein